MNQQKIGSFLKELRKGKNITQEQFAELMGVSNRSVSRWETGTNMPDLDILIQIAEYYDVEIGEILDGERKIKNMNKETKETILKVADYSNEEKTMLLKKMSRILISGMAAWIIYTVLFMTGLSQGENPFFVDVSNYAIGFVFGALFIGFLYTSGYYFKIKAFRKRMIDKNQ